MNIKESINTPFGKVIINRISNSKTDKTVIIIPGFSESITHNKKLLHEIAKQGYNVITFSQPRDNDKNSIIGPIQRQSEIILNVLKFVVPNKIKVYAVAHSFACAAVLKSAQLAPERFAQLILMQPVGISDRQRFAKLLAHAVKKSIKNQIKSLKTTESDEPTNRDFNRLIHSQMASIGVLTKNPKLSLKEALSAGVYDIKDDLVEIKKLGIPVAVIVSSNDEMFDHKKINLEHEDILKYVDICLSISDCNAGHDTFWIDYKRTASIIGEILN